MLELSGLKYTKKNNFSLHGIQPYRNQLVFKLKFDKIVKNLMKM